MSLSLSPMPKLQFFNNNGLPLSGGNLYTYNAGQPGVPKATYTDGLGTTYNTNPIVLDTAGRASIWLEDAYYMELWTGDKTLVGSTLLWTQDNVTPLSSDNYFKNALNTITSFFANANTVARTYTFQDRDGTIADNINLSLKANLTTNTFTGAQIGTVIALTSSLGAIAINLATNNNFSYLTAENSTLGLPTNPVAGQSGIITITQGATACTLAYNTFWKFAGGTVPTLTATAGAVDVFAYNVESATRATANLLKDTK